jgi:hypothetical protein
MGKPNRIALDERRRLVRRRGRAGRTGPGGRPARDMAIVCDARRNDRLALDERLEVLSEQVSRLAKDLAAPRKIVKTITTKRDDDGNLTAQVVEDAY